MLTVYRASAGSGKTHLLTGTYLRLLFQDDTTFDNILAVTFTNKATEEMKERIISQLFVLSNDPEKSDYYDSLQHEFQLTREALKQKSFAILKSMLHNYSGYHVSTIDHFFQQVMRAFTREIGLQGGYNIELDQKKVLTKAVDMLIDSLSKEENQDLLHWLKQFTNDKIENGQDWNIRKDLLVLAQEISKEEYKRNSDKILAFTADKKNLSRYIATLKEVKNQFEEALQQIGQRAMDIMREHGLNPADFSGKSRSPFFSFEKWAKGDKKQPTATFLKLADDLSKWAGKGNKELAQTIESAYAAGLNDQVLEVIALFETIPVYLSATESLRYIYTVGILSDIDRNMRAYCKEQNLMMISDTTELLSKIIDGSDNPFIYEKLGAHIRHFMIDEFQDTSGMQWDNFQPLVGDSVSEGLDNLIVGDVKQSIYRWRSSDWMLLHRHIRNFVNDQRKDEYLTTNWRSASNVIGFNNAFFTVAAKLLQAKFNEDLSEEDRTICEAYEDICQQVSPRKSDFPGHVRIEFIDPMHFDNLPEDEDVEVQKWDQIVLERLPKTLMELQDHGYALKDIAILVRTGKEGAQVAERLLEYHAQNEQTQYRFDVISNDSLYISQSEIVSTIVSFMKFLLEPDSPILRTFAAFNLLTNLGRQIPDEALRHYFYETDDLNLLFESYLGEKIDELRSLPLYEMTEKIITLVSSSERTQDQVYLQAFQDVVLEYMSNQAADLAAFISWWDERGVTKTISTPEDQDAIRIMTIHKSKGLGFKAVIIPFASWKIDHDSFMTNIIWSEPQVAPFNEIPLVPLRYGKSLLQTIYSKEYLHEKLQTYIDNLNVAYVAFTRAEEEMIIFAPKVKKPESVGDIASLLLSAVEWAQQPESEMPLVQLQEHYDPEAYIFEAGTWVDKIQKKQDSSQTIHVKEYISIDPKDRLQLRLHGKGYFNDREERIYGNLMHEILSSISQPDQIDDTIQEFVKNGTILRADAQDVAERLHKLVKQSSLVEKWFDPEAKVYTETEILVPQGSFLRPDRIVQLGDTTYVIDYKFGLIERKRYQQQVSQYVQLLQQMNFEKVVGYIWYVELGKIVAVEEEKQLSLF